MSIRRKWRLCPDSWRMTRINTLLGKKEVCKLKQKLKAHDKARLLAAADNSTMRQELEDLQGGDGQS